MVWITNLICKNWQVLSKDHFLDSPNNLFLHSDQSIAVTCTAVWAWDGISNPGNSNRISGGIQGDSYNRNPHKSWHNCREVAEKQRVAVILISHTHTRRRIHPPGKLPTFLMYFHFCAFKFIQFFPYCCLINNNDICNLVNFQGKKKSLKEMWPYSCRCLTVPISILSYCNPQCLHISDHQHKWLYNYSCSKYSSTTKKWKASSTKSKPRNTKSIAMGEQTEIEHFYWQKWARGWITLIITCGVGRQEGILSPGTAPRSWWVTLPAQVLCTQQGPCISPLETGLQECKMNSIFFKVELVTCLISFI